MIPGSAVEIEPAEHAPEQEPAAPEAGEAPAAPVRTPRNQHLKVAEPKNKQFTGRATESEFLRINKALAARKRDNSTYDIVRLCLDMLDHIEADFLQTFKTK